MILSVPNNIVMGMNIIMTFNVLTFQCLSVLKVSKNSRDLIVLFSIFRMLTYGAFM